MLKFRVTLALAFALLGALVFSPAQAQSQGLNINIVNGTKSAIPITVVPFGNETVGPPPTTKVSDVVQMDLARSGKFRTLDKSDVVEFPTRGNEIKFPTWSLLKQDYIVVGHVKNADNGQYRIGFELWNVNTKKQMLQSTYTAPASKLRDIAHQIADQIYQKITGVRGAFYTRIAYVTAVGTGKNIRYSLIVADSDGYNPQVVVRSRESLLSPTWSPDGNELAYVSFESGNSAIYIQNLSTGARRLVSARKGINGAPAFSPDGTKLAVSLSYVGNPEIFIIDLATGKAKRLTHNYGIDTEPVWVPNSNNIIFTSDRSGKPQLYEVNANGGTPTRVTFQGDYNADASVSYDGKQIAMVQGKGNVYRIAVMDRSLGGQEHFVSPGNFDESPSFAPNGSMLLYAATEGLRGVLYSVSADGKVRQRLVLSDGDVREPSWGPYRKP
ncbi:MULTISPECIES: Tol-Pal system beta propeller repeat protein TolB [Oleiagrimonas]|uniref:Tol-Pal system protein TolB n=1 Tax=Oleiagrimonas citrea TaxID=1665687 RepID=A0A846ZMZ9_9GAMM|nr:MULTISPECIES: Tol-Pal system beta propeller repeat protein TolB [Oleiagrimonas]NKZ39574.1 Tol-Pal system beta propeller repeat protein TolB [Oleiagrimonas citrea]RAP59793.1 Tol-Pal system beta propeller repeat protein TolB [Oleiagrimonas sp. MCCC 1A03011]